MATSPLPLARTQDAHWHVRLVWHKSMRWSPAATKFENCKTAPLGFINIEMHCQPFGSRLTWSTIAARLLMRPIRYIWPFRLA